MLLPIEFTPELVKDAPPELAEKMISLHKKNTEFTTAIKSHDYEKICFLLEVGAPFSIFAINEDEKKKISPEAIKGLKNSYRDIFIHHIINYSFDENNEKIIELLADNFFFSSNNYLMMFRKCYFAKTKNLEKSLDFFSKIMNTYNDLKQYKFEFISAAMYNKNTDLFKQMVSIFEKYSDDMDDHSIPLKNTFNLSSQHQTNLNKDSLAYYYDNFF